MKKPVIQLVQFSFVSTFGSVSVLKESPFGPQTKKKLDKLQRIGISLCHKEVFKAQ